MKKVYIAAGVVILAFAGISFWAYQQVKSGEQGATSQPNIVESTQIEPKTKSYYEGFRKKCEQKEGGVSCCLSSVNNAELFNSFVYSETALSDVTCPGGFRSDMNKCPTSYIWCSVR